MIDLKITDIGSVRVIHLIGKLGTTGSLRAEDTIQGAITEEHNKLVLTAESLEYMSSNGLRIIVAALKKARKLGGDLRLAALPDTIAAVADMAGLNSILLTYTSVQDAIDSYNA